MKFFSKLFFPISYSQALAVLEQWHYTVYDDQQNICHFGIMKTENLITSLDENARQVSINTDILGIQIRNMKMVFNIYGTWRRVMFEKIMMNIYDFFLFG